MPGEVDRGQGVTDAAGRRSAAEDFGRFCEECSIVKEADHRIANHLSMLAAYLRLKAADLERQPAAAPGEQVGLLLQSVAAQIGAVARVHRTLLLRGARAATDLSEHLHGLCAPLATVLGSRIELVEDCAPGCPVHPDQLLPLSQIVAEVIANAVKHGYPAGQSGRVLVHGRSDPEAGLVVEIVDGGPGLPEGFDPTADGGLGFQLVRALGRQIGATIAFESADPGLRFSLALPPAPVV